MMGDSACYLWDVTQPWPEQPVEPESIMGPGQLMRARGGHTGIVTLTSFHRKVTHNIVNNVIGIKHGAMCEVTGVTGT